MIKTNKLNKGDKIAIVTLSRGLLGMPFVKHELELALKRLEELGLVPVIMNNSLKDMKYLEDHPEERAADLKQAFMDNEIKGIITAIGGIDTYKTFEYLIDNSGFLSNSFNAVRYLLFVSQKVTKNPLLFSLEDPFISNS